MARIRISLVIIMLITFGSILSTYVIRDKYSKLLTMVEHTQSLVEEGRRDEAIAEAERLMDYWGKLSNRSHFLVRSDKIADLNSSIARIKPYIEDESEELNAEIESVKGMIEWLYESEMPYPNNIF